MSSSYRVVVGQKSDHDPRSASLLVAAHSLGMVGVEKICCQDLFFLDGSLSPQEMAQLTAQVLHDPVTQILEWEMIQPDGEKSACGIDKQGVLEVCLRPGVTDPAAGQVLRAAQILGIRGLSAVSTGQRFIISGPNLNDAELQILADRLLCNPVIQRYVLGEIKPVFSMAAESTDAVQTLPIRGCDESALMQLSQERRAALDLQEMKAIQAYYEREKRDPTDIEFEMIAQTWSEHCVHKTFKAYITLQEDGGVTELDNLFKQTIVKATRQIDAPWVRSAFSDNAGIIDYDGLHEISFKVETHNHPSAIEPFGGANTGTGGVIRDVLGVSARPIASTDVLCFGPTDMDFEQLPAGVLHPDRIASGVVGGIQDYGNKIGVPTVNGAILYDPGYTSNPLVFCGCVGIAPLDAHPAAPCKGDRVVVIGGRTGRDGLRGATFSSMTMDAQTGEVAGASVQIGAPIVEKGLIDVVIAARDRQLYHAITDCGAGGLSSAVGEMAGHTGAQIQLERVPLKYPGLTPWEVWLSEAQERMVLAVPPAAMPALEQICDLYAVELTDIGVFTEDNRLVVRYQEKTILDLENAFIHEGIPQRQLTAVQPHPRQAAGLLGSTEIPHGLAYNTTLLQLLSHPNIASKERVIRLYDHEVQGATVIKPLSGKLCDGPSDACVLHPLETQGETALVISAGINPQYGKLDPAQMAVNVIDEAIRNAVAVGADPERLALLDNFCWGDPNCPQTLGGLVAAALACREAAVAYGTPFISGKDSFNNEYLGKDGRQHAIPPTLLISAIGLLPDWRKAVSMDAKQAGDGLYLVGPFRPTLGGSHLSLVLDKESYDGVPACQPQRALAHYRALYAAIQQGFVRACHDLSEGGLAVAAAEMCIGGRLGMQLDLPGQDPLRACFGETTGCLLVEVPESGQNDFERLFSGLDQLRLGWVTAEPQLGLAAQGQPLMQVPVPKLLQAWKPQAEKEVSA